MIKLVTCTWSQQNSFNIKDSWIYRSFCHFNGEDNFAHIHFDQNQYKEQEEEFNKSRPGDIQPWYLFYKLKSMLDFVKTVESDYLVFSDARDTICMKNISFLPSVFDLDNYIICSMERNQVPNSDFTRNWPDYPSYSEYDLKNGYFLNSGVWASSKKNYIAFLENFIEVINKKPITLFADQSVFTYHYNMRMQPLIKLDYSGILVVSSCLCKTEDFYQKNGRMYSKQFGITPAFVHDNGNWHFMSTFGLTGSYHTLK